MRKQKHVLFSIGVTSWDFVQIWDLPLLLRFGMVKDVLVEFDLKYFQIMNKSY